METNLVGVFFDAGSYARAPTHGYAVPGVRADYCGALLKSEGCRCVCFTRSEPLAVYGQPLVVDEPIHVVEHVISRLSKGHARTRDDDTPLERELVEQAVFASQCRRAPLRGAERHFRR